MKLVCHNEISFIYSDGDNWIWNDIYGASTTIISKAEKPLFPLAAVAKWDFDVDDAKIIDELRKSALKGHHG